jgi:short subunit dehydrogenase-like uncharacterized protein
MNATRWMIYGANGYTGQLVAEEAVRRGMAPILAGRREEAVRPLAERLGCEHRVFELGDPLEVAQQLDGVGLVLLCAGPFSRTSRPMVDACLSLGIHYLDITGEISVFEACHARTEEAARLGSILLPGVGFDVVPSDCLAAALAGRLPGATSLQLAFHGVGSPSAGTARTMLEGLPQGGAVRQDGRIVKVPLAWKTAEIPFHDRRRQAVLIPWGDVSTAYYSTGIGNIEVYMAQPPRMIRAMKLVRPVAGLLRAPALQRLGARLIERRVTGPDAGTRESGKSELWGRVSEPGGAHLEGTLTTPEGYRLTALSATEAVARVLAGGIEPGAHTPSSAFGADFITGIEGCTMRLPEEPASWDRPGAQARPGPAPFAEA